MEMNYCEYNQQQPYSSPAKVCRRFVALCLTDSTKIEILDDLELPPVEHREE
jgi:hypothetical protein